MTADEAEWGVKLFLTNCVHDWVWFVALTETEPHGTPLMLTMTMGRARELGLVAK